MRRNLIVFAWLMTLCFILTGVTCLLRPSYISPWHRMDRNDVTTLRVTFTHGFGELPVYCDVQVRSFTGFIFPGIGSGFIDDDEGVRGGVLFYYNSNQVGLIGPIHTTYEAVAYVILTGGASYVPENAESITVADVRVRLWKQSDFPPPNQVIEGVSISTSTTSYTENHQLLTVPVMTIVQVHMTNGPENGWVTQAQGSYADNNYAEDGGGTMFGVNANTVKIWTDTAVFGWCDGWGTYSYLTNCKSTSANVVIKLWKCLESDIIFSHDVGHSIYASGELASHQITITSPFSHDDDLIIVRMEATTGSLAGYYFDGMGAALTDTTTVTVNFQTGGLVYATNNATQQLRLWHSLENSACINCRCMIKVPSFCGKSVTIHVVIIQGKTVATTEYSPMPLYAYVSERVACYTKFTCNTSHYYLEGEMESYLVNGNWTNTDNSPNCVKCGTFDSGTNAVMYVHSEMPLYINYTCKAGHNLVSGNLERTCMQTGINTFEFNGTEPICQAPTTTTEPVTPTTIPTTTTQTTTTTTTAAVTTTPTPTSSPQICFDVSVISSPEEIEEAEIVAQEISKILTVEAKSTSAFQRTLTSAKDARPSALYVGLLGYLMFAIVFGLLLCLDIMSVIRHCTVRPHHKNNVSGRKQIQKKNKKK